jgi:hypothetical protein
MLLETVGFLIWLTFNVLTNRVMISHISQGIFNQQKGVAKALKDARKGA